MAVVQDTLPLPTRLAGVAETVVRVGRTVGSPVGFAALSVIAWEIQVLMLSTQWWLVKRWYGGELSASGVI